MFELITQSLFYLTMTVIIGLGLAVTLFVLTRDVLLRLSGSGLILLAGLMLVFVGERWMGDGTTRTVASGLGLVVLLASFGLRAYALGRSEGERRAAHTRALGLAAVALAGLGLYAVTLDVVVDAVGFEADAKDRWVGVWRSLSPLIVALGSLPILAIDRVLATHPRAIPRGALSRALANGLSAALAVALVFPVNYLANHYDKSWDLAYFRTTKAGSSTRSIVAALPEPVSVTLFYPAGNDVKRELDPYFGELAAASGGQITVKVVDQALDPVLSEKLGVRDNGYIALTQGDHTEKFKLDTDLEKAKNDLKKLDENVRKHLIKLTRGQRVVYWLVGHGEASHKEKDDVLRKLSVLKRGIFDPENLKLEEFGVSSGSAERVPDDAALVVVAAPQKALMPEEIAALKAYADGGGHLLLLADVQGDALTELLAHFGLEGGTAPLANEKVFVPINRGISDRINLATNKFGSHESVKTLSRNATQLPVFVPGARWIAKSAGAKTKVTTLMRSFPDTWEDADRDFAPGEGEEKKVWDLAVAVTPEGDGKMRAIVVGDVNLYADALLQQSQGNAIFARDTLLWLLDDPDAAGEVESEEDVQIVHTSEEDIAWFALTVFGVPLLILGLGLIQIRLRGRNA